METIHKLIILGSGPAGLTAAIYAARSNLKPIVISGPMPGGQLVGTSIVENWPGNKQIMGPALMKEMREHAASFDTQFIDEAAVQVDLKNKPFTIITDRQKTLKTECIIIATGATPKKLNCPGEDIYWGKGITTCAVCDATFYKNKKVLIIGGGDSAMEDASFLKKFTDQITIVQIMDRLTASYAMQQRVINDPSITILYNTSVSRFDGDNNKLNKATLINQKDKTTQELEIDGAFLAIGLSPNTALFKGQVNMDKWGYIILDHETHTSVPGVFAAGDVEDFRYRQAVAAAGAGCKAALDAERYLKSLTI